MTPVDKKCKDNEHFAYNEKNVPICVCDDNFVRIDNLCVEYDVCNPLHREMKNENQVQPCNDKLAACHSFSNNQYECICPSNLYNKNGIVILHCLSKSWIWFFELFFFFKFLGEFDAHAKCGDRFCDLNLECDQKCSYNETTGRHKCRCFNNRYELDSDNKCQIRQHFSKKLEKCLPENDQTLKVFEMPYIDEFDNCRCKFGYKYDKTNKKCKENGMEFKIDSDFTFLL